MCELVDGGGEEKALLCNDNDGFRSGGKRQWLSVGSAMGLVQVGSSTWSDSRFDGNSGMEQTFNRQLEFRRIMAMLKVQRLGFARQWCDW